MAALPPPQTTTTSNLGLAIKTNGQVIGATFEWSPTQQRTATPVYEFGFVTAGAGGAGQITGPGEPYEQVPGNVTGLTITLNRYDLYTAPMETAWGTADLTMLSKQDRALEVQEFTLRPDNTADTWIYKGCWFTQIGRRHSATTADRIVMVNASLAFARRVRS